VLTGIHATADAWIIRKNKSACVIMTNLAMPSHPIQTEELNLRSSAQRFWLAMGELEYLSALQIEQLETASALRKESQPWTQELGTVNLIVTLAPQSVAAHTRIRSTLNQPS
jgi:xylan 1,4-beta-xylosidase